MTAADGHNHGVLNPEGHKCPRCVAQLAGRVAELRGGESGGESAVNDHDVSLARAMLEGLALAGPLAVALREAASGIQPALFACVAAAELVRSLADDLGPEPPAEVLEAHAHVFHATIRIGTVTAAVPGHLSAPAPGGGN